MVIVACAHCGLEAKYTDGLHYRKYCSTECRTQARRERRGHEPDRPSLNIQMFTCGACGEQWSRPAKRGQAPKWCPDCSGRYSLRECPACGEQKPITKGSKSCRDCWETIKPEPRCKALVIYTGPPLIRQQRIAHVRTTSRLTSGQCRVCDTWFVSQYREVTCSDECTKAHKREQRHTHEATRRARKKAAFVANVYRKKVFEADGYRCHICGKKTDKTKKVPHPKAPTIDHLTPIALGGTHEPANCRTACFMCNAIKSDKGAGDQLMLLSL